MRSELVIVTPDARPPVTPQDSEPIDVSVALCTFNGARFIEAQLASILNQTRLPMQIVVSDDGSSDDTLEIIYRIVPDWQRENPQHALALLVLENAEPLGVTANFAQALSACTGDLIALSDQDDIWPTGRLERLEGEFARRPELLLLHTDARLVDENGTPTGQTLLATLGVSATDRAAVHDGRAIDPLLRRNIVTGATTMLRRALVARATPFPAVWVHDEWLAIVSAATGRIDVLDESLLDYRQHGGNQIGASSLDAAGRFKRLSLSRAARNQRLLTRAEVLNDRAKHLVPAPSAEILEKIAAKTEHERMRSSLHGSRVRRVGPVLRAWRRGDYSRFGLGAQDVLRDLVQPT
jgi:glycosyltransferase involved in cell wall biosynthesis